MFEFQSTHELFGQRFRIDKTSMLAHLKQQSIDTASGRLARNLQSSLISHDKLRQLYREMLRLRQDAGPSSGKQKQKRNWAFVEASIVGCTVDLRAEDSLIASSTDFPNIANAQFVALNSTDSITALATGAALLHRLQAKANVVVAFVDGKQVLHHRKVLRLAHLKSLPIIFVQLERTVSKPARRLGIEPSPPCILVDKADVVAVYRVASEAIDKARRGAGPTLITCVPFSLSKTSSTDHHSQDPIQYMEYYLRKKNLWTEDMSHKGV